MPARAPRPCRHAGCFIIPAAPYAYCSEHQAEARQSWAQPTPPPRIRGAKLQAMRRRLFAREPLCRLCRQQGRLTAATIRDHVIPLAEGGRDDQTNEQPVCADCHRAKTAAESQRGRRRTGKWGSEDPAGAYGTAWEGNCVSGRPEASGGRS